MPVARPPGPRDCEPQIRMKPRSRDSGPHSLLELAPELRHEALLVFPDLDVALGDQLLAVAGAHAQEPHGRIMSRGGGRSGGFLSQAEDVHRAGASAEVAQAGADGL